MRTCPQDQVYNWTYISACVSTWWHHKMPNRCNFFARERVTLTCECMHLSVFASEHCRMLKCELGTQGPITVASRMLCTMRKYLGVGPFSSEMIASRTRGATPQYIMPVPVNSEMTIYSQYTPLVCSLNKFATSSCSKTHKCSVAVAPMEIATKCIAFLAGLDSKMKYVMQQP